LAYALDKHQGPDLALLAGQLETHRRLVKKTCLASAQPAETSGEPPPPATPTLVELAGITQELLDLCRTDPAGLY